MTDKDPLAQAEEVMADVEREVLAEQVKAHAEMILLAAVTEKHRVQGHLLFKAEQQGPEYLSGTLMAIGLTARMWGHVLADQPDLDFTRYIEEDPQCAATDADAFAHHVVRSILTIQDTPKADEIRKEIILFCEEESRDVWGPMTVHAIAVFADLMIGILNIKNGDYRPGDDDAR